MIKANLFQKGHFCKSEYSLFCQLLGTFLNKYLFQYELCLKSEALTKNILKNGPGICKKSRCSLCKSENPLYKNIPSEKNLLLFQSVENVLVTTQGSAACRHKTKLHGVLWQNCSGFFCELNTSV